jgi:hypothetical protein
VLLDSPLELGLAVDLPLLSAVELPALGAIVSVSSWSLFPFLLMLVCSSNWLYRMRLEMFLGWDCPVRIGRLVGTLSTSLEMGETQRGSAEIMDPPRL